MTAIIQQIHHMSSDDNNVEQKVNGEGNGACPQGVGKEDNAGVLYFNDSFNVNQQSNDFVVEFDLRRGLKTVQPILITLFKERL